MTQNEIELKVQELTNTYYSYSDIEDYLRNSADDIGYNDKVIYLSNGWEEIAIHVKYTLTEDYDVIIHSIEQSKNKLNIVDKNKFIHYNI